MQVVDEAVRGRGKGVGFPDDPQVVAVDHALIGHAVQDAGGHRCGIVVLVGHAQDGVVVLAGVVHLVVLVRFDPLGFKEGPRGLIPGVG